MSASGRQLASLILAGGLLAGAADGASAATAHQYYANGHRYAYHHRHYYHGNPAIGAAVAGTALGIIGLAAGAAAADRYDDYGGPGYYGPGYGAYGPGYSPGYGYYGGYGGYAPY